ncbi:MAG TPA: hypothetical protein VG916_11895 [Gemmatimonadaceae bacterium]|nr:hypothetical protein [Gemmatimonadaceae bacterium]
MAPDFSIAVLDGGSSTAAIDAGTALGRLAGTLAAASGAVADVLVVRNAIHIAGGADQVAAAILAGRGADGPEHDALRVHEALRTPADRALSNPDAGFDAGKDLLARVLDVAGLRSAVNEETLARLDEWRGTSAPHGIIAAAVTAGAVVTAGGASTVAERAASLAGSVTLFATGCVAAPWIAPARLDAASRSAAVQVDRSGAWQEWVRAWCAQLARESARAEAAVVTTVARCAEERAAVRGRPRVGATDAAVLAWLHTRTSGSIRDAAAGLGLTIPTVGTSLERLAGQGLVAELTGQRRDRIWVAGAYLDLAAGG